MEILEDILRTVLGQKEDSDKVIKVWSVSSILAEIVLLMFAFVYFCKQ